MSSAGIREPGVPGVLADSSVFGGRTVLCEALGICVPGFSPVLVTFLNSSAVCSRDPVCPSQGTCHRGCHDPQSSVPVCLLSLCPPPAPGSSLWPHQVLQFLHPCGLVVCSPLSCCLSRAGPSGQRPLPTCFCVCFVPHNRVQVTVPGGEQQGHPDPAGSVCVPSNVEICALHGD